ncbi:MAG TPA: glycoside hydrolase family 3 N-terminal domain-containing protein [Micromonosporaceae bacterium]
MAIGHADPQSTGHGDDATQLWRDRAASTSERVGDLMARMTLREKVAQLSSVWLREPETDEAAPQVGRTTTPDEWGEAIRYGMGQLTRVYGTSPVTPVEGAQRTARLQRDVVTAGRFGIPALLHEECLAGVAAWQATIYPNPLCWGASFDPGLVEAMGARIGRAMRRLGVHQGLAPVLDVVRDLRWGRVEETIGEDPYLVGLIGGAYVRGLESAGVVATLKHFVGHAASRAGRNLAPVSMGARELADVMLPPFEAALRAGARSVMNSYTDVDGVPVAADAGLLTDLLRDRYGFTGTVVSDYFSVAFLRTLHGVAARADDAAAQALHAGIDVELPNTDCYGPPLEGAVASGGVDVALVDRAVARVLTQKCELGLLDSDWSPDPPILRSSTGDADPEAALDDPSSRALARRMAQGSIVLLRNDGILPLRPGQRIAVVGPQADNPAAMLGCYSFLQHVALHHPDLPPGVALPTLVESLRSDPVGYEVTWAQGCPVLGGDDEGVAAAVRIARDADVCVVALGDVAALFGLGTSGEGCDASDLRLPGRQEELLEAVLATGTPVVLVLLTGRPYELSRQVDRLAGVVCGFFPGEEGAPALADVLGGRVNPSGRLPVSFPAAGANQPSTYLAAPLAHRSAFSTVDPTPVFPFGHGLSYAPATWVEVALSSPPAWRTDGNCRLRVTLRNDADIPTAEVVQVYLHDPVAEVARPGQQLIAAAKVDLDPGTSRTVSVALHADLTSYTGRDGRRIVDPGDVELRVGASSTDVRAVLRLTLAGARREVGPDRVLHPDIS